MGDVDGSHGALATDDEHGPETRAFLWYPTIPFDP